MMANQAKILQAALSDAHKLYQVPYNVGSYRYTYEVGDTDSTLTTCTLYTLHTLHVRTLTIGSASTYSRDMHIGVV